MPATTDGLILLFLSTFFIVGNTQSTCRPTGSDGIPICCPYFYIKENSCLECPVGYQVLFDDYNCSIPCYYPSYGKRCSKTCGCSKEDCHHVHGCPVITTVVTTHETTSSHRSFSQRNTTKVFIVGNTQSTCRPTGSDGIPICCPYFYIKEKSCLECPVGYQVLFDDYNCSIPCFYPKYGKRCGKVCGCSKEDCHHVQGCPVTTTVVTTQETTSSHRSFSQRNTTKALFRQEEPRTTFFQPLVFKTTPMVTLYEKAKDLGFCFTCMVAAKEGKISHDSKAQGPSRISNIMMPATIATSERTFSSLCRVKIKLRSTMTKKRLNHLMILQSKQTH
uniref:Uncharacterized protein LOC111134125 isoform X1 n=1 Tax=Crassostrea virginica TaxID=6565 RepID=A0A8B8EGA1_CRAVI|nr:uncharacterized protein LOC111134125 isoform X1 [Crassostrea virginica]